MTTVREWGDKVHEITDALERRANIEPTESDIAPQRIYAGVRRFWTRNAKND